MKSNPRPLRHEEDRDCKDFAEQRGLALTLVFNNPPLLSSAA
jgi:hypothetical protein